jgi:transcriptional regulator NrdR family protein
MKKVFIKSLIGMLSVTIAFGAVGSERGSAFLDSGNKETLTNVIWDALWGVIMNVVSQNGSNQSGRQNADEQFLSYFERILKNEEKALGIKMPKLQEDLQKLGNRMLSVAKLYRNEDPQYKKFLENELKKASPQTQSVFIAWNAILSRKFTQEQSIWNEVFISINRNKKPVITPLRETFDSLKTDKVRVTEFFNNCRRIRSLFEKGPVQSTLNPCDHHGIAQLFLSAQQNTGVRGARGQQSTTQGRDTTKTPVYQEHICDRVMRELTKLDEGVSRGFNNTTSNNPVAQEVFPVLPGVQAQQITTIENVARRYDTSLENLKALRKKLKQHSYNASDLINDLINGLKKDKKNEALCREIEKKMIAIKDNIRSDVNHHVKNSDLKNLIFNLIFNIKTTRGSNGTPRRAR